MKTVITADDRLRIVGLLTLASDHNKSLQNIERSIARIVGADDEAGGGGYPYFGHVSDAVAQDYSVDDMLARLEITVDPEPSS